MFGPQTEDALLRFQTMLGRSHASGIVGEEERHLLALRESERRHEELLTPNYGDTVPADELFYVYVSESGGTTCRKCSEHHLQVLILIFVKRSDKIIAQNVFYKEPFALFYRPFMRRLVLAKKN